MEEAYQLLDMLEPEEAEVGTTCLWKTGFLILSHTRQFLLMLCVWPGNGLSAEEAWWVWG